MPQLLNDNSHSSMISTKEASEISGYHADYLARLCRQKKIVSQQIGRNWFVDRDSLDRFIKSQEDRNQKIAKKLRESRRKEYRKAQKAVVKGVFPAARVKATLAASGERAQAFARRTLAASARTSSRAFSSAETVSPRLVALAVSLVVVAGSAYASTDSRLLSFVSAAPNAAVRFAFESASRPIASSSFRMTDPNASVTRIAAQLPSIPDATDVSRAVALVTAQASMSALASANELMDASRVPLWQTDTAKIAQGRLATASRIVHDPLGSIIAAYVGTGELADNAGIGIFDAYLSGVQNAGNSALTLGAATRDAVALLPPAANTVLDAYTDGIYAFSALGPKTADHTVIALYTIGDTLAKGTAQITAKPQAIQRTVALNAAVTLASAAGIGHSQGHSNQPALALATSTTASQSEELPAAAVLGTGITEPIVRAYGAGAKAEGALLALPLRAEDTMLGAAGYASSLMDGTPQQDVAAQTASPEFSFLGAFWQAPVTHLFHSLGTLGTIAQAVIGSGFHTLASLFPGGNVAAPALTVLPITSSNTISLPVPAGTLTSSQGNGTGGAYTDNRTIIQNIINNYTSTFSPGALVGSTFDDAVMAVVRPFVQQSVDNVVRNEGRGYAKSEGGTLTNVTIDSGNATLSNLTAATTSLATTTITGPLSVNGVITAPTLNVGTLSSTLGIVVPYITATDTAATSTFTNLTADTGAITNATLGSANINSLTIGSSTFASLLGTALTNVGGILTVSTTSISGSGSLFNADLLDGLDSTYLLANSFSTTSAGFWFGNQTTDALAEGLTNLYYTDARARGAISASGAGLSYASSTGILSVASGYSIPLTASTTDWNTAYVNRITAANLPLSISNNTISISQASGTTDGYLSSTDWTTFNNKISSTSLSALYPLTYNSTSGVFGLAFGTSTSNTWGGTQTFTNAPVLGSLTGFIKASAGVLTTSLIDLSTDVSTTLPVSHGGTGSTSLTGLLKGNGTSPLLTAQDGTDYLSPATIGASFYAYFHATTTDALTEGTSNLYYTNARARSALSSAATGLSYNSSTGAFTLTSGYVIPLTASTTEWSNFYATPSTRITAGTNLSWSGNTLNGPTDSYLRGLFSAASPLSYNSSTGAFSFSTTSMSGAGSNFNADLLDGFDSTYYLANSFSTTSANAYLATKTTTNLAEGANLYYTPARVAGVIAGTTTDALAEGAINKYYTDARARASLSFSGTGLSYVSGTGVLSVASGYTIPLTASTTDWNTAYVNRITAANLPLSISNNTISISQANATTNGYLSSTDWTTFNGKQDALTGTTGQFPYFSGTNTVTATSSIFLDTTGNVGIGKISPANKLEVVGSIVSRETDDGGNAVSLIAGGTSGNLNVYGAGTPTITLTGSNGNISGSTLTATGAGNSYFTGNLGIGTTSADARLVVNSAAGSSNRTWAPTSATVAVFDRGGLGSYIDIVSGASGLDRINFGNTNTEIKGMVQYDNSVDALSLWTATAQRLTINAAGNVGIGTTSPFSKLSVAGDSYVGGNLTATGTVNFTALGSGLVKSSSGTLSIAVSGTDYAPATSGSALLYGNGAGGFSSASVSSPLTFIGGALGIQTASGSQAGALSAADWTTFNAKQAALTFSYPLVNSANTVSLAFGTTTANTWSALQTLGAGFISQASSTVVGSLNVTGAYKLSGTQVAYLPNQTNFTGTIFFGDQGTNLSHSIGSEGQFNTAVGLSALTANSTGDSNTAVGYGASLFNSTGNTNTAVGAKALFTNTTGSNNVAIGYQTLLNNNSPNTSVAIGYQAGLGQGAGTYTNQGSVLVGYTSGYHFHTGADFNTLIGFQAGYNITTGSNNIVLGIQTTIGSGGITTGSNNILIGKGVRYGLDGTASNQLNIGNLLFGTGLGTDTTLSSGNIGVGTSSPSEKLSVNGNILLGSTNPYINFNNQNTIYSVSAVNKLYITDGGPAGGAKIVLDNATGNVGIGTTSPSQRLSVQGNAYVAGTATIGTLNGLVKGTTGVLSAATDGTDYVSPASFGGFFTSQLAATTSIASITALPNFILPLSNVSGTLAQANGGTGLSSFTMGDILYADNSGNLTKLPVGSTGQVLKVSAGVPSWGQDETIGSVSGGDGVWATSTNAIFPLNTSDQVLIGNNSTTTTSSIFEVTGQTYLSSKLGIGTTSPAQMLSVNGAGLFSGTVTVANLIDTGLSGNAIVYVNGNKQLATTTVTGPLTFSGGTLGIAQAGSGSDGYLSSADWNTFNGKQDALTFAYPLLNSANTISLAFGTTTANTWSALQTFSAGISAASVTNTGATADTLAYFDGSKAEASVTLGTGLTLSGGTLAVSTSTFSDSGSNFNADLLDGFDSTYFFAHSFSTTSADSWLTGKSTSDLAEGTNLYFTNARAQGAISVSGLPLTYSGGVISINQASGSQDGYLSSTDWNTFNSKQAALTGTTGQFPYFSGANSVTATSSIFLATSGYVGIGTTSPMARLTVSGTNGLPVNSAITASALVVNDNTTNYRLGLGTFSTGTWIQSANTGTSYATLALNPNGGNIGIGTTTPSTQLHIDSGIASVLPIISLSAQGSSVNNIGRASAYFTGSAATDLGIRYSNNLFLGNVSTPTMVLTSAGNVGIGTTTPASLFNVEGSASTNYIARFTNTSNAASSEGVWIDSYSGNNATAILRVTNSTNNREILTATGAGNIGIGTTTPSNRLAISTSGTGSGITFDSNGTVIGSLAQNTVGAAVGLALDGVAGRQVSINGTASSPVLLANGGGNVGIGTTSPFAKLSVGGLGGGTQYLTYGGTGSGYSNTTGSSLELSDYFGLNPFGIFVDNSGKFNIQGKGRANPVLTATASGNVGIGTTSPDISGTSIDRLVVGSAGMTSSSIAIDGSSSGDVALDFASNGALAARITRNNSTGLFRIGNSTNSANDFVISSAGNVGIGTTTPSSKLAISGAATIGADYNRAAPTNGLLVEGNVGIGTTTTSTQLTVGGNSLFAGPIAQGDTTSGSAGVAFLQKGGDDTITAGSAANYIDWINATSRTDVTSSFIGLVVNLTTADATNIPIVRDIWARSLTLGAGSSVTNQYGLYIDPLTGATNNYGIYQSASANTNYFAGNIGIGTTTPADKLHVSGGNILLDQAQALKFQRASTGVNYSLINTTVNGAAFDINIGQNTSVLQNINFQNAAGTAMTLSGAGNLGIGTTSPAAMLGVSKATAGDRLFELYDTYGSPTTATALIYRNNNISGGGSTSNALLRLVDNAINYPLSVETSAGASLLAVQGNGNVGFGTSSPYAQISLGGGNLVLGASAAGGTPGDLYLPKLGTPAGAVLAIDGSGKVIATSTSAGVSSVGVTYPLLTTGGTNPTLSLDFGTTTSNTWAGTQTFTNAPVLGTLSGFVKATSGTLAAQSQLAIGTDISGLGTGVATFLATPTTANFAAAVTGETGTGSVVFSASPTFSGTVLAPIIAGGSAVSSTLTLKSTSGAGTSDALIIDTGNSVERARLITTGQLGLGTTTPFAQLEVASTSASATFRSQLVLTDNSAGAGLKHFGFTYAKGTLTLGSISDSYATTSALSIMSGGNVGIGTSSPGSTLSIGGNSFASGYYNTSGTTGGYQIDGNLILQASSTNSSTLVGASAGTNLLSSSLSNVALGQYALRYATSTSYNTAVGFAALSGVSGNGSTGNYNSAFGYQALFSNTTGVNNVANGAGTLLFNTTGSNNVADGYNALSSNQTGSFNIANGSGALFSNLGSSNIAVGFNTLASNTTGSSNTAIGESALYYNSSATSSVALGYRAGMGTGLYSNSGLTALGYMAGLSVTTGSDYNTLLGYQAGYDITTGANNIVLGTEQTTGGGITTGSNNILIGTGVRAGLTGTASNQLNIGNLIFATGLGSENTLSTGNVGIGTSTPTATLAISGTTGQDLFQISTSTNPDVFRVNENGAVGIGTPDTLLGAYNSLLQIRSTNPVIDLNESDATGNNYTIGVDNNVLSLGRNGAATLSVSDTNVGIGSSSPNTALAVTGSTTITGAYQINNTNIAYLPDQSVYTGSLFIGDGGQAITNASADFNTGVGIGVLASAVTNYDNTAVGYNALNHDTGGGSNNAFGFHALFNNTNGNSNDAFGDSALDANTTGSQNEGFGGGALGANTSGSFNSAFGSQSLFYNTTGTHNVAIGYQAGNTWGGLINDATSSTHSIYIGYQARGGASGETNAIVIGDQAAGLGSNTVVIGNNSITTTALKGKVGIGSTTPWRTLSVTGTAAMDGLTGSGGTLTLCINNTTKEIVTSSAACTTSDERLKTNIAPLSQAEGLAAITALRPVSFDYKDPSFGAGTQLGFLAQEVAKIFPEFVSTSTPTSLTPDVTYTLNYQGLITPTIKALQELAQGYSLQNPGTASSTIFSSYAGTQTAAITVDSQGNVTMGKGLTASSITANSLAIAQSFSAGAVTAQSLTSSGTVTANRYVVPQNASVFAFGSTTISMQVPAEALTAGGVDLYQLAGYATAGVQALASRFDLFSVKIDDLETRVAALEALHSATTTATTTDAQSSGGFLATLEDALSGLGIIIHQGYLALDSLVTHQLFLVQGQDGTSSTGSEIIPAGATSVTVTNPLVHTSSKIFLTFTSSVDGSWYLSKKQEGSFTITLAKPQPADTEFDYFLIQTDPNAQVASVGQAQPAGATEAPSAPASVTQDGGPVVTLNGDAAVQIVQGASWTDPGATAVAADGTNLTSSITVAGSVDTNTAGLYTLTYNVVDASGKGGQASRVVTVLAPTTAPSDGATVTAAPTSGSGGADSTGTTDTSGSGTTASTDTTASAGTTASTDTSGDTSGGTTASASEAGDSGSTATADTGSTATVSAAPATPTS